MSVGDTTVNIPPLRRNYRHIWIRLACLGAGIVVVIGMLIAANWVVSGRPKEEKIVGRAVDSGQKFTPAETVKMPVVKPAAAPPPPTFVDPKEIRATVQGKSAGTATPQTGSMMAYVAHTPEKDQNSTPAVAGDREHQDNGTSDNELSASLQSSARQKKTAKGHILKNPRLVIPMGVSIPCRLQTMINTTKPGFSVCYTTEEVRGKHGDVKLLPKWTRFFGEISQSVGPNSDRTGVLWTNASTPDDIELPINSPGTDSLGGPGIPGQIERHVGSKLGALALYTLLEAGPTIANTALQNNNRGGNSYNTTSITGPSQNVLGGWLQQKLQQPDVLIKNQGEIIYIMVAQNWDLSCCINLEARQ